MEISTLRPRDAQWEQILARTLVEAAQGAARRTRAVFLLVNVAGAIVLSAQFSATFSWLRYAYERAKLEQPPQSVLIEQLAGALYRDLYMISVPLLGIKLSVTDIQLFAGGAMVVLAVWWFYCVRREHHAIADVVFEAGRYSGSCPDAVMTYFYGMVHHFVFTTTTKIDTPSGEGPKQDVRLAVKVLALMPVWVPLLVVGMDVISLLVTNPGGVTNKGPLWFTLPLSQKWEAGVRDGIALLLGAFCWRLCHLGGQFDESTRKLMERFGSDVRERGWTRGGSKPTNDDREIPRGPR